MSPVPGVSILSLNQMAFGEEYRAAKHPLDKYRQDVDQFRKAAGVLWTLLIFFVFPFFLKPILQGCWCALDSVDFSFSCSFFLFLRPILQSCRCALDFVDIFF